jgi:tetratricopeptide (TPR) repeat protein
VRSGARAAQPRSGPLEARHARAPGDREVTLALGEAYYGAGRFADALPLIERVVGLEPDNEEAALFEAFTLDTLGRLPEARDRYESLADRVGSGAVRRAVDARRTIIGDRIRVAATEEAVAGGAWPGATGVVYGVLPLRYAGSDTVLRGVGVGLAELMAEELARPDSGRAGPAEFERLLGLQRALGIADDALGDPAVAIRLGRMLRVRSMLQGTLARMDSGTVRLRVDLVEVASGRVVTSMTIDTALDQVAAAGAVAVARAVAARAGGPPRAEPPVLARRLPRVEALVALGRGLLSWTAGDLQGAAEAFHLAVLHAPSWAAARAARDEAILLLAPPHVDPRRLVDRVAGPTTQAALQVRLRSAIAGVAPHAPQAGIGVPPDLQSVVGRKPVAEATGSLGPEEAARAVIQIIVSLRLMPAR